MTPTEKIPRLPKRGFEALDRKVRRDMALSFVGQGAWHDALALSQVSNEAGAKFHGTRQLSPVR